MDTKRWGTVVRLISVRNAELGQLLRDTPAIGPTNGVLTVEAKDAGAKAVLESAIRRALVEQSVEVVFGGPIRVRFVVAGEGG